MKKSKISRRAFLQQMSVAGSVALVPTTILANNSSNKSKDTDQLLLTVSTGHSAAENTKSAINALGGMRQFVSKGNTVGVLVNSPWDAPGSYTNPDVALEVIAQCFSEGASKIHVFPKTGTEYWKRASTYETHKALIDKLESTSGHKKISIAKGKNLKEAEVVNELFDCDVFINIPVAKHHQGTNFSCNLKNMMGLCPYSTNRYLHSPDGKYAYNDLEHLAQSIADLNLVRKTDLCIVDATQCMTTNGPAGPGQVSQHNKVIASTDAVAADTYAAKLLGYKQDEILMLKKAEDLGIGNCKLKESQIKELA